MEEDTSGYSFPFFNQYLKIPERIRARMTADHPAEYEGVRHCVGLILVNLLARGEVAYSRNSNFYTGHRTRHYTRTNMLKAVEIAAAEGYAVRSLPGYKNPDFGSGLSSTLRQGQRLRELGPTGEMELDVESLPLLVMDSRQVFDSEGLASIIGNPGPASPESLALMPRLPDIYDNALRLNREYWNGLEISRSGLGPGKWCLDRVGLTRVFKKGGVGRWFQRGGLSYQQLAKGERAKLLLGGGPVVEIDYHAMHPHILYAWEDEQCPEDFYERILELCGCTRGAAKLMTLMAVNAGNYRALVSAVNFGRRRKSAPTLYDELKRLGLEPRDVVQALVEAHPIMERYVYGGQALRLMFVESEVMTSALLRLMELGIPALPVHDSVIAPKRHREQVKQVMEDAYREYTSFGITVE